MSADTKTVLIVNMTEGSQNTYDKFTFLLKQATSDYKFRSTNLDEYLSGKLVSTFDMVVFGLLDTDYDDMHDSLKEMIDHYANAPILGYFNTVVQRAPEFVWPCDDKPIPMEHIVSIDIRDADVPAHLPTIVNTLKKMTKAYDDHKKNVVRAKFDSFDKDGSGAIDYDELRLMLE